MGDELVCDLLEARAPGVGEPRNRLGPEPPALGQRHAGIRSADIGQKAQAGLIGHARVSNAVLQA